MTQPAICNSNRKTPSVPLNCNGCWWLVSVEFLSDIETPNRSHAYILPDNSVWILDYDCTSFIQINNGSGTGGQPTIIRNSDGYISVQGSGTYTVTTNLNETKLIQLIKSEGGISDVPNDGKIYARKNGAWVETSLSNVPIANTSTAGIVKPDGSSITVASDGTISAASIFPTGGETGNILAKTATGTEWRSQITNSMVTAGTDATTRGVSAAVIKLGVETHAPVKEAPQDGGSYVRKDGSWVAASSGGVEIGQFRINEAGHLIYTEPA